MIGKRMKDFTETLEFNPSPHPVQKETDLAIREKWALGDFVTHHISPESHNFSNAFTQEHVIGGGRVFHDLCHPILALAYKKLGLDLSQFRFWYNGNHCAEAMVIPMERFFDDMVQPNKIFSLEYYKNGKYGVRNLMRNKIMEDRMTIQRAITIANASTERKTIFEVCRDNQFDMEQLLFSAAKANRNSKTKRQYTDAQKPVTKWGEVIQPNLPLDDVFLDTVFATLMPGLNYIAQTIKPDSCCTKQDLQRRIYAIQTDAVWDAINIPARRQRYQPTIIPPSP
jgi:hypothetical protein